MAKLVQVNNRKQISLGKLALFEFYMAWLRPDGSILLTPSEVVPAKREPDSEQVI